MFGKSILILLANVWYSVAITYYASLNTTFPFFIPYTNQEQKILTVFIASLFHTTVFPSLFAFFFGKIVMKKDFDCKKNPSGAWIFVGNPYPESGIIFYNYPDTANTKIAKIAYLQPPTLGGMFMYLPHAYTIYKIKNTVRTSSFRAYNYFVPECTYNETYFLTKLFANIVLNPIDRLIWERKYKNKEEYVEYHWLHISHTKYPAFEYHMLLPQDLKCKSICLYILTCVFILWVMLWSWGTILFVLLSEIVIRKYYVLT
jgi:hypothetical protein